MTANDPEPAVDDFHRHEVLHTAFVVSDPFDRHLLEATAVRANPVLLAKAEAISELLGDFHQAAGQL